jgi:hypothetical protein
MKTMAENNVASAEASLIEEIRIQSRSYSCTDKGGGDARATTAVAEEDGAIVRCPANHVASAPH